MTLKPQSSFVFSVDAAFRLWILAYPAEFRAEYGTEMVRTFRDLYRNMRARRGIWGVMAFWFDALTDVLATVAVRWKPTVPRRDFLVNPYEFC